MSQKDPKLTFAAQSIRLSWGRLWRVALSKTGRANPGEMLAPWFPYKGDAAMIGNETGRRGKPSSVQKPQGGFFDAHFWEHPHRTLSRCAMTLAIQSLITNRCRELGLGQAHSCVSVVIEISRRASGASGSFVQEIFRRASYCPCTAYCAGSVT